MVVAVLIPRFPLLVALLSARRPLDLPVALGPAPGEPQVVGLSTPVAEREGVAPGLRVGEALARCPGLELVAPDPEAVLDAHEGLLARLESTGAAVETIAPGVALFESRGLQRLHGGLDRVLAKARAALPVGADGRVGAAGSRFVALQAAREAPPRRPLVIAGDEVAPFLAPLPIDRLGSVLGTGDHDREPRGHEDAPLEPKAIATLQDLGVRSLGELAELPRAAVLDRFGMPGIRAWRLARGEGDVRIWPRRPPSPLETSVRFPDPVGSLPVLQSAARMLLYQLAADAAALGFSLRTISLRARLGGDGSWTRTLALREATADPERLAAAALPNLDQIAAPVAELTIRAEATTPAGGRQLTAIETGSEERRRRTREAIRHVRAAQGEDILLRAVEVEPWSRLPERRWALVPFDT
jgi:protein ImuB